MAWVAQAAGFRSNSGNGIIAGFPKGPFGACPAHAEGYFSFGRLEKKSKDTSKALCRFNELILKKIE